MRFYGTLDLHQAGQIHDLRYRRHFHRVVFSILTFLSFSCLLGIYYTWQQARASDFTLSMTISGIGVCGDGVVDAGEDCDEGVLLNSQGSSCAVNCQTPGSQVCGNGTVESGEQCDDGNVASGDGCSSSCQTETHGGNGPITPPSRPGTDLPYLPPQPPPQDIPVVRPVFSGIFNLDNEITGTVVLTLNYGQLQTTVPVMTDLRPIFSGQVNVPYAIVRLTLQSLPIYSAVVRADGQGSWSWQAPEDLSVGQHQLVIEYFDSLGLKLSDQPTVINFIIQTVGTTPDGEGEIEETEKTPADDLIKQTEYLLDIVAQDSYEENMPLSLELGLQLYNDGLFGQYQIKLRFINDNGQIVDEQSLNLDVSGLQTTYTVDPNINLKPGHYRVIAELEVGTHIYSSESQFQIKRVVSAAPVLISVDKDLFTLQILVAALAIFILALYLEYRLLYRLGKLYHPISEDDLRKIGYIN